jgi:hypothetical protein
MKIIRTALLVIALACSVYAGDIPFNVTAADNIPNGITATGDIPFGDALLNLLLILL